jgi:hypothetical protein
MGFFNPANYESAKKILEKAGWNVPDVRGRKESTPIVVTKDKEQFSISPGKFTTDSTNQSTFEAMLQAFKASNPNVTHVITTNNEENKGVWIKAYNQVYKDKPAPTIVIENSAPSKDKGNEQSSPDAGSRRPN